MIRVNLSKAHSSKEPVECWYDLEDYYFFAHFSNKVVSQCLWRISRYTLTFNIFPETQLLQSIDAYSPSHNWICKHDLSYPIISSCYYNIRFVVLFNKEGIGKIDNDDAIQYHVSDDKQTLRLIFENQTNSFFAIAPNVVVGVYNNSLSELWFNCIQ